MSGEVFQLVTETREMLPRAVGEVQRERVMQVWSARHYDLVRDEAVLGEHLDRLLARQRNVDAQERMEVETSEDMMTREVRVRITTVRIVRPKPDRHAEPEAATVVIAQHDGELEYITAPWWRAPAPAWLVVLAMPATAAGAWLAVHL